MRKLFERTDVTSESMEASALVSAKADALVDLPVGNRVDAYCDLHRRCSSLKALEGERKGRVVAKPKSVVIRDVDFRVSPGGMARARDLGVRNVHAYARGTVCAADVASVRDAPGAVRVDYNPFREPYFCDRTTRAEIKHAAALAIDGKVAWAVGVS